MPRPYPLDPTAAASINARRRALGWSLQRLAMACDLSEGAVAKYLTLRCCMAPAVRAALEQALSDAEAEQTRLHRQEASAR
jgi:hypothetical protein